MLFNQMMYAMMVIETVLVLFLCIPLPSNTVRGFVVNCYRTLWMGSRTVQGSMFVDCAVCICICNDVPRGRPLPSPPPERPIANPSAAVAGMVAEFVMLAIGLCPPPPPPPARGLWPPAGGSWASVVVFQQWPCATSRTAGRRHALCRAFIRTGVCAHAHMINNNTIL